MSRIGNLPIKIPEDVTVSETAEIVTVKGPKGKLSVSLPKNIGFSNKDQIVTISRIDDSITNKSLHGLARSLVANAVTGVTKGFSKTLEIKGVGYRAKVADNKLILTVGFSHLVEITQLDGITFQVQGPKIIVSGIDKQFVGEVAAQIRRVRPPEAYKGKGIRYVGEYVRIKAGKAAKSAAA